MIEAIKYWRKDTLVSNTSWLLLSEAFSKVSRIATVLAMAATLDVEDYGIAALCISCHEILRIFSRAGAGAKVIQCAENKIRVYSETAVLIQWIICLLISSVQILGADAISAYYERSELKLLLQITALSYIFFPLVSARVFDIQRQNKFRTFSAANTLSVSIENIAIVILLFSGSGVIAIAAGKVLSALAWAIYFGQLKSVQVQPRYHAKEFPILLGYSCKIFCSDLIKTLRTQLDVILAGKLLSVEMFGYYSFAKNAGVGLTHSVINSYLSGVYPYFCSEIRNRRIYKAFKKSLVISLIISVFFVLQAGLSPIYIPILFNDQWISASGIVSVLCLTAITSLFCDLSATLLRAQNLPQREFLLASLSTITSAVVIFSFSGESAMSLATAAFIGSLLWLPIAAAIIYSSNNSAACDRRVL